MSNLNMLVELVGEDQAEQVLKEFIKGRFVQTEKPEQAFPKLRKKTSKGAHIPWAEGEKERLLVEAEQSYRRTPNWASVARELSKTYGRSVSSLFNIIYNSGITKKYATE